MPFEVDWNAALATVNGDTSLLKLVINAFLTESEKLQEQIAQAIQDQDPQLLHRAGHTLKGTMASLGATDWSNIALRLEELGASGISDGAEQIAEELNQHLPLLLDQLRNYSPDSSD